MFGLLLCWIYHMQEPLLIPVLWFSSMQALWVRVPGLGFGNLMFLLCSQWRC